MAWTKNDSKAFLGKNYGGYWVYSTVLYSSSKLLNEIGSCFGVTWISKSLRVYVNLWKIN